MPLAVPLEGELSGVLPHYHRDIDLQYWILCWSKLNLQAQIILALFSILHFKEEKSPQVSVEGALLHTDVLSQDHIQDTRFYESQLCHVPDTSLLTASVSQSVTLL